MFARTIRHLTAKAKPHQPLPKTAPGWNQSNATESEAHVKAEKSPTEDLINLQKETVRLMDDYQAKWKGEYHTEVDIGAVGKAAPGWNPSTATESEADVKADRSPNEELNELQKDTVEWVKKYKDGMEKKNKKRGISYDPLNSGNNAE